MDDIEKIDNVTWYGHCVIHLMAALNDLPDEAKLDLCQDLSKFIERQHKLLRDTGCLVARRMLPSAIGGPGADLDFTLGVLVGAT